MKNKLIIVLFLISIRAWGMEVLVEAENFHDKGGWVVDQQFMDQMGSPYLMAHGLGKPVADASTTVVFDEAGVYYVFVRTYNWTAPWYTGVGPGAFYLKVNGKKISGTLGDTGDAWQWQPAGKVKLKAGEVVLSLHDLSGFNGRCDAVYFTTDTTCLPPAGGEDLEKFRRNLLNPHGQINMAEGYDLVVAGGGIAGISAAISAARLGCKVALINDRPVLGGCNSSEIRVHLGGRIEIGKYPQLGNLIKEIGPEREGNAKPADYYEDAKKMEAVLSEENIDLYLNYRVIGVDMEGRRIGSLLAKHIETGQEVRFSGRCFADCTGDGTVGYLAGADYRMGRESRDEFGEVAAPEVPDSMTMGASVQWYSVETKQPVSFPEFSYGLDFNEMNCQFVTMGEWTWETGMDYDQITDSERIRDYGLMVVFSNWSFLKNGMKDKSYAKRRLEWVAYVAGKRESRRLMGDYILKQDDLCKNVFHEDASFTTTWTIDLHYPDSLNSVYFPGGEFISEARHIPIYPYAVPYRCLYSRNTDNLFMAGRNISVTHVALGTVRVMRTTGMMGEVVGMAASLCKKYDATPRQVYQSYLNELETLMKKGVGQADLPNNQRYNEGGTLSEPPIFEWTSY